MNTSQVLAAISPIVEAFEQLGVLYHIGGSVASSVYGILRATIDADLVADRQWNDILGVLKVQGTTLDMAYLLRWAVNLNVTYLLERALVDAGLKE